jgi:hypothetical protein
VVAALIRAARGTDRDAAVRRPARLARRTPMRDLLVDALAVARLTRLVTDDTLPPLDAARRRAYEHVQQRHGAAWAEGITCPWCVSVHVGIAAVIARRVAPRAWDTAARALALSYAVGWLSSH